MKKIKSFEDLEIWQLAENLAVDIYKLCQEIPVTEKYNLISQLKRAVISISSNIAEGFGRYHPQEYIQFLRQSRGSLYEVKSQLLICIELRILEKEKIDYVLNKIEILGIKLNNTISIIAKRKKQ